MNAVEMMDYTFENDRMRRLVTPVFPEQAPSSLETMQDLLGPLAQCM